MSAERRIPKEGDFEITRQAYGLIIELMDQHSDIEMSLWVGAFWSLIASCYKNSGVTDEQFMEEAKDVCEKYKNWIERKGEIKE